MPQRDRNIIYPTGVTDDGAAPPRGETEKLLQRQLLTLQNQRLLIVHTANILSLAGLWILCRDRRRYLPKSSSLLACALAVFVTGLCCQGTVVFVMAGCTLESTPPPAPAPAPAEMTSCLGMIHLLDVSPLVVRLMCPRQILGFAPNSHNSILSASTLQCLNAISTKETSLESLPSFTVLFGFMTNWNNKRSSLLPIFEFSRIKFKTFDSVSDWRNASSAIKNIKILCRGIIHRIMTLRREHNKRNKITPCTFLKS